MKFYSDVPNLHIVRQRLVGNRQEGYLLCKFDENGELETEEKEVIRQLINIYRHEDEIVDEEITGEETIEGETSEETPIVDLEKHMKQCKKCDFTCENQGELLFHYKESHPKSR